MECLDGAGCATVTPLGDEQWHCYRCVAGKSDAAAATRMSGGSDRVNTTNASSASLLNDDALEQMTNQRLVKARAYMSGFKTAVPPLSLVEQMNADGFKDEGDFLGERTSIFDQPEFALRLWSAGGAEK